MERRRKGALAIALLATLAGAGIWYVRAYRRAPASASVETTGTVEGIETNIASKIPGRLRTVRFREGDRVKTGDLLAELEGADLQAALGQARSAQATARAALAAGRERIAAAAAQVTVASADVESARASVAGARARLAQAERDLRRDRELFGSGLLTKASLEVTETAGQTRASERDAAVSAVAAAAARREAARKALDEAKSQVKTLEARIAEARDAEALAQARLADTRILSPVDAVVEYRALEPGEVVGPGQSILTLIDPTHLWVRIDLEQRFLGGIRGGQAAQIALEGAPEHTFPAEVMDIGQEGAFAVERDVTRGRQDIKTFRTRLRLLGGQGVLKPGMTVLVTIPAAR
ncbi:MAG: efflux RND transporter periplasmic adaptor subunit [Deltaproteobacteria bacterium]|nr:efflux RND transporter periplasmic adaptor subunit [Deltaproteobacteria bacterium]